MNHDTTNLNAEITILFEKYLQLMKSQRELNALYAAGVDNWEGYEIAMKILEEE